MCASRRVRSYFTSRRTELFNRIRAEDSDDLRTIPEEYDALTANLRSIPEEYDALTTNLRGISGSYDTFDGSDDDDVF